MGIDSSAAIFVGLPRSDFKDSEQLSEWVDSGDLEVASPHYDGQGEEYAIVGHALAYSHDYGASEFTWDQADCDSKKAMFRELTGMDAKVYITPHIT